VTWNGADGVLECDYLVVGAGAMGMAFVDELLHRNKKTPTIIHVDRHAAPGGHWNDTYPHVHLHQSGFYYGVGSKTFQNNTFKCHPSGPEVLGYYIDVAQQNVSTGRWRLFPNCEYEFKSGEITPGTTHYIKSLVSPNKRFAVRVREKVVNATYQEAIVPSVRPPKFGVDKTAQLVPPNDLWKIGNQRKMYKGYVVLGAGKTGLDAVLFLLDQAFVEPADITWIMPNDAWFMFREHFGAPDTGTDMFLTFLEALLKAEGSRESFKIVEEQGKKNPGKLPHFCRFDESVEPNMWRCATVTADELDKLRSVKNVVRMGRVVQLGSTEITLEKGTIPTDPGKLHIDCTGNGLRNGPPIPVFQGRLITLQSVFTCQQVFSAAVIGHIESSFRDDDTAKNFILPCSHPFKVEDHSLNFLVGILNLKKLYLKISPWLMTHRLVPVTGLASVVNQCKISKLCLTKHCRSIYLVMNGTAEEVFAKLAIKEHGSPAVEQLLSIVGRKV